MVHVARFRLRAPSFRRDERGATAVEFALVSPLLCFALLSLVEIGMLGMMTSGLDNSLIEVARKIRTGRTDGPVSATTFEDQVCANLGGSASKCRDRLVVSVQKYTSFSGAGSAITSPPNGSFDKGAAGDIIIVKADYNWPLMSPFIATAFHHSGPMTIVVGSRLAFKNEPFK